MKLNYSGFYVLLIFITIDSLHSTGPEEHIINDGEIPSDLGSYQNTGAEEHRIPIENSPNLQINTSSPIVQNLAPINQNLAPNTQSAAINRRNSSAPFVLCLLVFGLSVYGGIASNDEAIRTLAIVTLVLLSTCCLGSICTCCIFMNYIKRR